MDFESMSAIQMGECVGNECQCLLKQYLTELLGERNSITAGCANLHRVNETWPSRLTIAHISCT
ncbi:MAG: hypothetical protein ACI9G1_005952 [Pirellulaceae bacterium]|jgi:hypothetical protein